MDLFWEFAIVLPDTSLTAAGVVAERVRAAVQILAEPNAAAPGPLNIVTVSIGVAAAVPAEHDTVDNLVQSADANLYEAKRNGRNRVASDVAD